MEHCPRPKGDIWNKPTFQKQLVVSGFIGHRYRLILDFLFQGFAIGQSIPGCSR